MKPAVAFAAFLAGSIVCFGQWPRQVSGGPKTADGKPDLNAPTPRTPDGKPDFTGTWDLARGPGRGAGGAGGGGAAAGAGGSGGGGAAAGAGGGRGQANAAAAPSPTPTDGPPLATFFNIGAGFKDGLPLQPWAKELLEKRKADNSKDNPDAHCLPMGLMQFHLHPQPRKILQTPKQLVIMYEANYGLRQIFTDGRSLPGSDPEPWWYGYSIGHWDGDTLVVETTGYRDDIWLDVWGTPMTSAAKTIERFRRPNYGSMQIDITIDDPKAYTKPFTVRVNHRLSPDTELIEFICQDRDAIHYVGKQ